MTKSADTPNLVDVKKLRRSLLRWYKQNRRDLPWRRTSDPYRIWVSEIMLQQTRVAAVLDHYARFIRRFPTVRTLAAARESSVLTAWSGLGYYNRARRMHEAARLITRKRGGEFPRTAEEWSKLPGVGRYTAAAVASIAFGEPIAAVDGNVERVLARVFGRKREREAAWKQAEMLLDRTRPGDFNQAMMELGATVCAPTAPQCGLCALNRWCKSHGAGPMRPQAARQRKRLYYALVRRVNDVLLVQRPADASLMAAMWELPVILDSEPNGNDLLVRLRHSITNTDYEVCIISMAPDHLQLPNGGARWFSRRQWERLPLTGLARKVLRLVASDIEANESKHLRYAEEIQ